MFNPFHTSNGARPSLGCFLALSFLCLFFSAGRSAQAGMPSARALSLDDRVRYQRALEEVNWQYRIWPKENPQPKPALEAVMPLSIIRAKVEDDLRKSKALEVYWQRPITGAQLQAEMARMARATRQPERLRALWAALDNDATVVAECLARPSLVNRLLGTWYSHEERFHGELKRHVGAQVKAMRSVEGMKQMGGEYSERVWVEGEDIGREGPSGKEAAIQLTGKEWAKWVQRLRRLFGQPSGSGSSHERQGTEQNAVRKEIPIKVLGPMQETKEGYEVSAVLENELGRMKLATVTWRKRPFGEWWATIAPAIPMEEEPRGENYRLPEISAAGTTCKADTWMQSVGPPDPRGAHTAVWTGTEMIIWGGGRGSYFNSGSRYDPGTDTWTSTGQAGAPSGRSGHTAVWTGTEMIVWGGWNPYTNTGGRYDPVTDTWVTTSLSGLVNSIGRYCAPTQSP